MPNEYVREFKNLNLKPFNVLTPELVAITLITKWEESEKTKEYIG